MTKKALITGITGQDGALLAELLIDKGYQVCGVKRRSSSFNTQRVDHLYTDPHENSSNFHMMYGDMTDATNLIRIVQEFQPDEIYNLAAQSHVQVSFETAEYTANSDALGTLRLLEAIRILELTKKTKFYQASTSEMYGKVAEIPQNENTPFYPRSAYGISKVAGFELTRYYRESYGLHASSGILFTHESPRRGTEFVTRKITQTAAKIKKGLQKDLLLGNIQAKRDWGHAKDYVEAMWLMVQQNSPEDYVVGTGTVHSVEEFAKIAFSVLDLNYENYIKIDKKLYRPTVVSNMMSDSSKIRNKLKWESKTNFVDLVSEMVISDYNALKDN